MDKSHAPTRAVVLGHLTITIPVIVLIGVVVRWGLYQFGPSLWPYYVTAGIAIAWQWYSMALPRWKDFLTRKGLQANQADDVAHSSGLVWPGTGVIGSFAVHTTAAAVCGIHFGPWLLFRWFVWILPLVGISCSTPRADYWLQHLELVSVIPALVMGFVVSRYFEKLASWAWILPTTILSYKLLTFTDAHASVFASSPWSGLSFYFVIRQHMPTFNDFGFGVSDPIRVAEQIDVTVPFYSSVAYSVGALLKRYKVLDRVFSSFRAEAEPDVFGPEEAGVEWIRDAKEQSAPENK